MNRWISIVFHPVFIFPVLTGIYFSWERLQDFLVVFGVSFFLPFLYFLHLKRVGKIKNWDVSSRENRPQIYATSLFGMSLSLIYLRLYSSPEIFNEFLWLILLGLTLAFVNFKIKVSIHMALITLLCFKLFQDFNWHPLIFLLIPVVAHSRLKLKRHTPLELILATVIASSFALLI